MNFLSAFPDHNCHSATSVFVLGGSSSGLVCQVRHLSKSQIPFSPGSHPIASIDAPVCTEAPKEHDKILWVCSCSIDLKLCEILQTLGNVRGDIIFSVIESSLWVQHVLAG